MSANITNNIGSWSVTSASNQPDSGDTADIQSDLQAIQSAVKKIRAIGADLASGATVLLENATGDFVTITGTTTISSLGTTASGLRYIIRFASALTLTHNGTSLICPGGVSLSVKANDVVWAESLGSGNWRIVAYLPVQHTRVWQDLSGSRAVDTEYTNSNSFPIEVSIAVTTATDPSTATFLVNGVTTKSINAPISQTTNFGVTVPPGNTYKFVTGSGSYTVSVWAELR